MDVLARAGAGIDVAGGAELVQGVEMKLATFGLIVGSERAAAIRAFLPVETEPFEVFIHGRVKFRAATGDVEVFVAQDKDAVLSACALLGDPERARVAEMQIAGGRRGDPPAVTRNMRWIRIAHRDAR